MPQSPKFSFRFLRFFALPPPVIVKKVLKNCVFGSYTANLQSERYGTVRFLTFDTHSERSRKVNLRPILTVPASQLNTTISAEATVGSIRKVPAPLLLDRRTFSFTLAADHVRIKS